MSKREEKKQKKGKTVYVDDGRSFADMSVFRKEEETPLSYDAERPLPRWRQIINTYFESMKMMFLPMLAFMGGIVVLFFILWLIFSFV